MQILILEYLHKRLLYINHYGGASRARTAPPCLAGHRRTAVLEEGDRNLPTGDREKPADRKKSLTPSKCFSMIPQGVTQSLPSAKNTRMSHTLGGLHREAGLRCHRRP